VRKEETLYVLQTHKSQPKKTDRLGGRYVQKQTVLTVGIWHRNNVITLMPKGVGAFVGSTELLSLLTRYRDYCG